MPIQQYIITGQPMPCPRPRANRQGHVYMPRPYNIHKKKISALIYKQMIIQGHEKIETPVKITMVFLCQRPKNSKGENLIVKATKPEIDNLVKTCLDALTDAGVWHDDKLVVSLAASKYNGPAGFKGQTEITIEYPWEGEHE